MTVLVEVTNDEDGLRDLVCSYLFAANGKSLKVYFVDLRRNEMIEYRRTEHHTIDVIKEPAGANRN